ncbi:hypothetical protein MEL_401 [Melbournevirus]|uniref:hypothetical protein n=1 Tax=Melbournevirus TaxID=1560514 RepID=UPI00051F5CCB|nr:hypothetical protein MEL_401 [Melbournevirus]
MACFNHHFQKYFVPLLSLGKFRQIKSFLKAVHTTNKNVKDENCCLCLRGDRNSPVPSFFCRRRSQTWVVRKEDERGECVLVFWHCSVQGGILSVLLLQVRKGGDIFRIGKDI